MCSNPGSTSAQATDANIHANSCTDFSYAFPANQPATGLNNWQYGYLTSSNATPPVMNPSTFSFMSPTPALDGSGNPIPGQVVGWWSKNFFQYWTSLDAFGAHSNADNTSDHFSPYCTPNVSCVGTTGQNQAVPGDYWADRRYIAPSAYTGPLTIVLQTQKDPRTAGPLAQGYTDYVLDTSGGTTTTLGSVSVPVVVNGTEPVYNLTLNKVNVKPGDVLDFVTVPNYDPALKGYADFSMGSFQLITIDGVPEPASLGLMAAGLLLLGIARKRLVKSR